jgi:hypothetical protein
MELAFTVYVLQLETTTRFQTCDLVQLRLTTRQMIDDLESNVAIELLQLAVVLTVERKHSGYDYDCTL